MGKSKFDSENQTLTLPTMKFFFLRTKPQPSSTLGHWTRHSASRPRTRNHLHLLLEDLEVAHTGLPEAPMVTLKPRSQANQRGAEQKEVEERSGRSRASLRQVHSQGLGCRQGEGPSLSCTAGSSCKAHLQPPAGQLRIKPHGPRA